VGSDVIRADVSRRPYWRTGLVTAALVWGVGLLTLSDQPSQGNRAKLRLCAASGALVVLVWGWVIPRIVSSWRAEIDRDAIRWHGGFRRRDRVIRRTQVVTVRRGWSACGVRRLVTANRRWRLEFYAATGERVGVLPLRHFSVMRVVAGFRRHGWPLPGGPLYPAGRSTLVDAARWRPIDT
jgi:hypothetical protein